MISNVTGRSYNKSQTRYPRYDLNFRAEMYPLIKEFIRKLSEKHEKAQKAPWFNEGCVLDDMFTRYTTRLQTLKDMVRAARFPEKGREVSLGSEGEIAKVGEHPSDTYDYLDEIHGYINDSILEVVPNLTAQLERLGAFECEEMDFNQNSFFWLSKKATSIKYAVAKSQRLLKERYEENTGESILSQSQ